jgi:adenylate kinase family enzyme
MKPIIIFFGYPLSGKGTQCNLLKIKLNIETLSTGDMFRAITKDIN